MTKAIVLYPAPTNPEEFERRYRDEHRPMVRATFAEMTEFHASKVVATAMGEPAFAYAAELVFPSMEKLQAALGSDEGQKVVGHAIEISTGGPMSVIILEELT
jgi:uncharacterized protein (TIGR02118 family)